MKILRQENVYLIFSINMYTILTYYYFLLQDNRHIHLYNLKNETKFNVSGELDILTKWSGQEYKLTALHSNRIVKFWTDYDILDKGYKQHSRLELSPSNWIEYDLNLFNKSLVIKCFFHVWIFRRSISKNFKCPLFTSWTFPQ